MSGERSDQDEELQRSTPNSGGPSRATGGMGVSSERTGPTGPGQDATDGLRDVSPHEPHPDEEPLHEQSAGNPEDNPDGLTPKAGYSERDPRSD